MTTVPHDESPTILSDDVALPEGPLLLPDGTWMVTELDPRRGTVSRLGPGGREAIAETGRPNGLARTADGSIWVAESLRPSLVRIDLDGAKEAVLTGVEGEPLLWPNDLCIGPDGALYVTDSGLLVGDLLTDIPANEVSLEWESLPIDGKIVRFDPASGEATILDRGYRFTNGIAFGPDGALYVAESYSGEIYRCEFEAGRLGPREPWANVREPDFPEPGMRGPDGMAFSEDGRLWGAIFRQGDITVLLPDGSVERRIPLAGRSPTNVAFGPPGDTRIYITETETNTLESREVGVGGLPLHS